MKKLITLVAIISISIGLFGCGKQEPKIVVKKLDTTQVPLPQSLPYSSLKFPQSPPMPIPERNLAIACGAGFREELALKDIDSVCAVTILECRLIKYNYQTIDKNLENYNGPDPYGKKGVFKESQEYFLTKARVDDVYYSDIDIKKGDILDIESFTGFQPDNYVYPLQVNQRYIVPIQKFKSVNIPIMEHEKLVEGNITRQGQYTVSDYAPQIQITLHNQYLFHEDWKSLINDNTASVVNNSQPALENTRPGDVNKGVVLQPGEDPFDFYKNKMKLRQDSDFIPDLIAMVKKYKNIN
ncbi:MAG: hypothetical protein K0R71_128 [Bacillales bacterium]|nr:hypothetical protein [Bacillales bacterium]